MPGQLHHGGLPGLRVAGAANTTVADAGSATTSSAATPVAVCAPVVTVTSRNPSAAPARRRSARAACSGERYSTFSTVIPAPPTATVLLGPNAEPLPLSSTVAWVFCPIPPGVSAVTDGAKAPRSTFAAVW